MPDSNSRPVDKLASNDAVIMDDTLSADVVRIARRVCKYFAEQFVDVGAQTSLCHRWVAQVAKDCGILLQCGRSLERDSSVTAVNRFACT